MRLELLIAALNQDMDHLPEVMRLDSEALIIHQCQQEGEEVLWRNGKKIRVLSVRDRGVGASRNLAMDRASGDLWLFSDEDIVYDGGYEERVLSEFLAHPEADGIFFNVQAMAGRETYHNKTFHRVTGRNCGRYPAYALAVRGERVRESGCRFSLLFGGGAKYSNGEDSLFFMDLLRAGLRLYASPVILGHELLRESTWFRGYTEKFFFDRGVLYYFLYGKYALPLGLRFLWKHRRELGEGPSFFSCLSLLREGIERGKREKEEADKQG